ncbi:homoserine dehydrogenase [Azospirillum sp. YIM DDC1]|uniref:Homoserine dehydrogenase n=1 Tax=Azospirillum aestuarii TaxID=2802052 RepID=A0ABS1I648_9PROT|nr:homoserine dehydrogenase [Azospirillum aestuarii]MBK4722490.1 homoserine dehydrogenase [Azospirillum aestuarii]TWA89995.1 homoserine dehydrogenase [Azospirillum brasilense]
MSDSHKTGPLKIAVAGLGTVGAGVLKLLEKQADLIEQRCGRRIEVVAVSARSRGKDRGVDLSKAEWYDDPVALAAHPGVDVVVELIGGSEGPAKETVELALERGRHVVTANKALLAHHGTALAAKAEAAGLAIGFEAAVAGGIPIIKGLREGLAGNRVSEVHGILNGTCNYILTEMRTTGRDFADVLADAQKLGYAEADPSFDIDGVDAAHKLAILTSVAFGTPVDFKSVHVEGIRHVSAVDFDYADALGYRIKLLGIARRTDHGIEQRVHPCMVPKAAPIAAVDGVFNAVIAQGDFVDRVLFVGRGAGEGPTASAVVADLIDIARGRSTPTFGVPAAQLSEAQPSPMEARRGSYYVRLMVVDRPGVIADVAAAMRDQNVSMEQFLQRGRAPGEAVPVVLTTHDTDEAAMQRALATIAAKESVVEPPRMIRIEQF